MPSLLCLREGGECAQAKKQVAIERKEYHSCGGVKCNVYAESAIVASLSKKLVPRYRGHPAPLQRHRLDQRPHIPRKLGLSAFHCSALCFGAHSAHPLPATIVTQQFPKEQSLACLFGAGQPDEQGGITVDLLQKFTGSRDIFHRGGRGGVDWRQDRRERLGK